MLLFILMKVNTTEKLHAKALISLIEYTIEQKKLLIHISLGQYTQMCTIDYPLLTIQLTLSIIIYEI